MELDHFAPTLGQNGTPCAILPPMICFIVSTLCKLFVIDKTDQFATR